MLLFLGLPVLASGLNSIPPEMNQKVDSLFVIASSGELEFRDLVQPAIDSIAAIGPQAVPRLIEKYDTQDARERLTINNILVKIGKAAVPLLVDALKLENPEQVSRICSTLGEIKDSAAVIPLTGMIDHNDWRVRSEAVGAIGRIGDLRGNQAVMNLLLDTVEIVRKSAAVSSGQLVIREAIPNLVHMLGDDFYGARFCASEALVKFGFDAIPVIADSLNTKDTLLGNLGCTTLGMIGGDSAITVLVTQLKSGVSMRRALAVEAIINCSDPLACSYIEEMVPSESDPIVLFYVHKFFQKYAAE